MLESELLFYLVFYDPFCKELQRCDGNLGGSLVAFFLLLSDVNIIGIHNHAPYWFDFPPVLSTKI